MNMSMSNDDKKMQLRFRANISSMGDSKLIINIPLAMHEMAKALKRKKNLMITVDDEED